MKRYVKRCLVAATACVLLAPVAALVVFPMCILVNDTGSSFRDVSWNCRWRGGESHGSVARLDAGDWCVVVWGRNHVMELRWSAKVDGVLREEEHGFDPWRFQVLRVTLPE